MKTGMNLLLWTDHVTEAHDGVLEAIKEIGFDSVEVPVFAVDDRKPYERLGKRLEALGLGATAVTVMSPQADPISADPAVRAEAVGYLEKVLGCVAAFGGTILCGPIHSAIGQFSGQGPTEEEFRRSVDTLRRVAEIAQGHKIRIATEYLNRFEIYLLTTAQQASRYVRAVDHPALGMMYDSFHAHIEEKDQAAAIASCAAETIHVHVSENDRGTPGTGQVDWDGFFAGLKQTGYDGTITIEAFGRALPALAAATRVWRDLFPDPYGLCREGLAFMKSRAGLA